MAEQEKTAKPPVSEKSRKCVKIQDILDLSEFQPKVPEFASLEFFRDKPIAIMSVSDIPKNTHGKDGIQFCCKILGDETKKEYSVRTSAKYVVSQIVKLRVELDRIYQNWVPVACTVIKCDTSGYYMLNDISDDVLKELRAKRLAEANANATTTQEAQPTPVKTPAKPSKQDNPDERYAKDIVDEDDPDDGFSYDDIKMPDNTAF